MTELLGKHLEVALAAREKISGLIAGAALKAVNGVERAMDCFGDDTLEDAKVKSEIFERMKGDQDG